VSEVADQVCDSVLVVCAAVLLENCHRVIAEDIITPVGFFVIACNSTFTYKGRLSYRIYSPARSLGRWRASVKAVPVR
jgi:hypothetical protein